MNKDKDPMGRAIADYWKTKTADRLQVFSPMFDDDEIPVEMLFRRYDHMPPLERKALDMANGRILDVGAGAGCHALALQERGLRVTAIDISPLAVKTMREEGVESVLEQDFFSLQRSYDTILMLMNGIGIVGSLDHMPAFFNHLDRILAPGGQVLCDSSDISYLFDGDDAVCQDMGYYGEHSFIMQYKDTIGDPFPWLYVDALTLTSVAAAHGYRVEVVMEGDHYDYLARITKA